MKISIFLSLIFCLLISPNVNSQTLSDRFEGSWEGKGTLMGSEAHFKMNWNNVLDDQFLKLEFTSKGTSNGEEILFHAMAMYQPDENWKGTWFDSRGIRFDVNGTAEENTLTVEWGSPEIEQGRTVYSIRGENEMTVTDYINQNGTYSKFGEAVYHRIGDGSRPGPPRVTGIGGVFFKSKDPAKTRDWYKTHLGFTSDENGGSFVWRKFDAPESFGFTVWHPFAQNDDYFNLSERDFMINYRVNNLEELIMKLESASVQFVGEVEEYPFGKFAWILDPDGQKVELWEPYDADYFQMLNEDGGQIFNSSN